MNIEKLLSRLDKVKSTGKDRWTCSCPSHEDQSPSMHIKLDDSGRILINCKAGCATYDILQSIGLDWVDVMPDDEEHSKPQKRVMYATEALKLLRRESQIIMACSYALRKGTLSHNDIDRATKAMEIINKVYAEVGI
jgi:hypothetical protein